MKKNHYLLLFLCWLATSLAYGQTRTVREQVFSEEDISPIPGVSVLIKGSGTGTATDIDGNPEQIQEVYQAAKIN